MMLYGSETFAKLQLSNALFGTQDNLLLILADDKLLQL